MEKIQYANIDDSKLPIIIIKYAEFEPTEDVFEEYLKKMESLYTQYSNFILVFDASQSKYLSSKLRIKQGKWINENAAQIKRECIAQIFVVPNAMVKMLFQGILLITKMPVPYYVDTTVNEALTRAKSILSLR